ncbi:hypothetical protein ES705_14082 [subsurface metagenome]
MREEIDEHLSKDPQKRQNQLNNLNRNGRKNLWQDPIWKESILKKMEKKKIDKLGSRFLRMKRPKIEAPSLNNPVYGLNIRRFAEDHFYIETRKPVTIEDWQEKLILDPLFDSNKIYHLAVIGLTKKDGKSTLASLIALHKLMFGPDFSEIYILANDLEQAQATVFSKIIRAIELNQRLLMRLNVTQDTISYETKGSFIKVLPSEYAGSFGTGASLVIYDELWAYESERARRLFEAFTENPTRPDFLTLVVSHAGYSKESLLYDLYKIGIGPDRPKDYFFLWSNKNLASWKTKEFLDRQRNRPGMRPNVYRRLYKNEWTEAGERFITSQEYNRCVNLELRPTLPDKKLMVWVGVDASVSGDTSAVSVVTKTLENKIRLIGYRIWKPNRKNKMNLERTIGDYLRELCQGYLVIKIMYDPYQLHSLMTNLSEEGLPVEELPQTLKNTSSFSLMLYEAIHFGNFEVFPDDNLIYYFTNAGIKENPQGFRLIKRSGKKIDIVVATGMATYATLGFSSRPNRGKVYISGEKRNHSPEEIKELEKERERLKKVPEYNKLKVWII